MREKSKNSTNRSNFRIASPCGFSYDERMKAFFVKSIFHKKESRLRDSPGNRRLPARRVA